MSTLRSCVAHKFTKYSTLLSMCLNNCAKSLQNQTSALICTRLYHQCTKMHCGTLLPQEPQRPNCLFSFPLTPKRGGEGGVNPKMNKKSLFLEQWFWRNVMQINFIKFMRGRLRMVVMMMMMMMTTMMAMIAMMMMMISWWCWWCLKWEARQLNLLTRQRDSRWQERVLHQGDTTWPYPIMYTLYVYSAVQWV